MPLLMPPQESSHSSSLLGQPILNLPSNNYSNEMIQTTLNQMHNNQNAYYSLNDHFSQLSQPNDSLFSHQRIIIDTGSINNIPNLIQNNSSMNNFYNQQMINNHAHMNPHLGLTNLNESIMGSHILINSDQCVNNDNNSTANVITSL